MWTKGNKGRKGVQFRAVNKSDERRLFDFNSLITITRWGAPFLFCFSCALISFLLLPLERRRVDRWRDDVRGCVKFDEPPQRWKYKKKKGPRFLCYIYIYILKILKKCCVYMSVSHPPASFALLPRPDAARRRGVTQRRVILRNTRYRLCSAHANAETARVIDPFGADSFAVRIPCARFTNFQIPRFIRLAHSLAERALLLVDRQLDR